MQYAIPQFTDVEDKLIGPLTLKQFLILLGTGGVVMFFWSLFQLSAIFFLFALPTGLLGITLAFAHFNGRSFFVYLPPFFNYLTAPKAMIYRREGVPVTFSKKVTEKPNSKFQIPNSAAEPPESRLQKLAYVLDQKTHQEEELIEEIK